MVSNLLAKPLTSGASLCSVSTSTTTLFHVQARGFVVETLILSCSAGDEPRVGKRPAATLIYSWGTTEKPNQTKKHLDEILLTLYQHPFPIFIF